MITILHVVNTKYSCVQYQINIVTSNIIMLWYMLYIILSFPLIIIVQFIIKIDNNEFILLTLILVGKYNSNYILKKKKCTYLMINFSLFF